MACPFIGCSGGIGLSLPFTSVRLRKPPGCRRLCYRSRHYVVESESRKLDGRKERATRFFLGAAMRSRGSFSLLNVRAIATVLRRSVSNHSLPSSSSPLFSRTASIFASTMQPGDFVCQNPGCRRAFTSMTGLSVHANHCEHQYSGAAELVAKRKAVIEDFGVRKRARVEENEHRLREAEEVCLHRRFH